MVKKGFDCATKLNKTTAKNLRNEGFEYAIRYLPTSDWKGLTEAEVDAIHDAGLKLVSIFQKSANYAEYFTKEQGKKDGKQAQELAEKLGQPKNTMIYFAVDYDAQTSQLNSIDKYFEGVKETLKEYKIGVYGSYRVVNHMRGKVDGYWQTYAWSKGKVAKHIHMHQYRNNVKIRGVQLDLNNIYKDPLAWTEKVKEPKKQETKKADNKITGSTYVVKSGDTLSEIAVRAGTTVQKLVELNNIKNPDLIRVGQVLKLKESAKETTNKTTNINVQTYTVKKGDTLSEIAQKFNTTVNELVKLNNIKNPNLIYVGQKLKIKGSKEAGKVYHKVKRGDTVSELAQKYGSTISQIKNWNNLKDVNKIYVGQTLRVK